VKTSLGWALRRRLRQARWHSRALRREDRNTRKRIRSRLPRRIFALWPLLPIYLGAQEARPDLAFLALALYLVGTSLFRSVSLKQDLQRGPDLAVTAGLPASDDQLLDAALRRFQKSALVIVWPLGLGALVAAWPGIHDGWFGFRLAAVGVVVAAGWTGTVALSALVATLPMGNEARRASWLVPAGGTFNLLAFGTLYLRDSLPLPAPVWSVLLWTPGGWVAAALEATRHADGLVALLWCVPLLLLAATWPYSVRCLRRDHRIVELTFSATRVGAVAQFETDPVLPTDVDPQPRFPVRVEPLTRSDVGLPRPRAWSSTLERTITGGFRPRELAVAEFLSGGRPGYTVRWKRGAVALPIAGVLAVVLPFPWSWVASLPGVVALTMLLPLMGDEWRALQLRAVGGQFSTFFAFYPVGFGDATRVMLRAAAVRLAAAVPLLFIVGSLTLYGLGFGSASVTLCLKIIGLLICAQPMAMTAWFSRGTSDLKPLVALVGVVLLLLAFAGVGLVLWGSVVWEPLVAVVGGFLLVLTASIALLWAYGGLYGSSRFDTLRKSPE